MLWKRVVVAAIMIIGAFVLQCTVLKAVSIAGATPNIIIFFLFLLGFVCGKRTGMLVGLISGLLIDCFYSDIFGVNMLILLLIGYLCGLLGTIFYNTDLKISIALAVGVDFLYNLAYYFCWFLLKGKVNFGFFFGKVIFPEIIYTFIIVAIFYIPLYKLVKYFFIEKEPKIVFNIDDEQQ